MIMGGFTLHPGVVWSNETSSPRATQQITHTILNNIAIHTVPILKKQIILEAKDSGNRARGYFTREQFEYLEQAEMYGSIVTIVYRSVSKNYIVIAGGVKLTPKRETESVESTDVHTGTVTFQEI